MKRVHPLPSMLTLANFGCGFLAIVLSARSLMNVDQGLSLPITHQELDFLIAGSAFLFLAMVFDMLDGKVARLTGSACEFGGELDSLADVVSFGIAPAVIMSVRWMQVEPETAKWWSLVLGCGFVYAACACIRLARYNVEMDTSAKNYFSGLPSPAAAGAVASMVLLVSKPQIHDWLRLYMEDTTLNKIMAAYMMVMGLLMVTKVKYVHASNRFLGGKIRFHYLAAAIFSIFIIINFPVYLLALLFNAYAIWGIVGEVLRRVGWSGKSAKQSSEPIASDSTVNMVDYDDESDNDDFEGSAV